MRFSGCLTILLLSGVILSGCERNEEGRNHKEQATGQGAAAEALESAESAKVSRPAHASGSGTNSLSSQTDSENFPANSTRSGTNLQSSALSQTNLLTTPTEISESEATNSATSSSSPAKPAVSPRLGTPTNLVIPVEGRLDINRTDAVKLAQVAGVKTNRGGSGELPEQTNRSSGVVGSAGNATDLDDAFLKTVAEASLADMAFAQQGIRNSKSKDISDWSSELKKESQDSLNYVKWLARRKNISLPDEPDLKHQIAFKELQNYSDKALAAQLLADQAELLGKLQVVSGKLQDPKVQSAAHEMILSKKSDLNTAKKKAEDAGVSKGIVQQIVQTQLEADGAATLSEDLQPRDEGQSS